MKKLHTEKTSYPVDKIDFIPKQLRTALKKTGILFLHRFQYEALKKGLNGQNLVISAPTGSGKTLISEILSIIDIIMHDSISLFLVPYKAIAEELKENMMQKYPFLRIGIATGDYRETPINRLGIEYDFIITTYEKADMIRRENPPWLKQVSLVTIDEIHLLGETERGAVLDATVTKFKMLKKQLIALSATIPNADEIARWLDAELIQSDFRPVILIEGIYLPPKSKVYFYCPKQNLVEVIVSSKMKSKETKGEQSILDSFIKGNIENQLSALFNADVHLVSIHEKNSFTIQRNFKSDDLTNLLSNIYHEKMGSGVIVCEEINRPPIKERSFIGYVFDLVYDLLSRAKLYGTTWQILIFRQSRKLAQRTALRLSEMLQKTKLSTLFPQSSKIAKRLETELEEPTPLTEELINALKNGVAFHHAGLTLEERKIIENAFRERKIGVIVATPTLGAGINLPARRVVIEHFMYDPLYGRRKISVAQFKQRGGRAGRPGLDQIGEAILISKNDDDLLRLFGDYIFGHIEEITSALGYSVSTIREQVLAFIVSSKRPLNLDKILAFFNNTFYAWKSAQYNDFHAQYILKENIKKSLIELSRWNFIETLDNMYKATKIGKKVSRLYLDPLTAKELLDVLLPWKRNKKFRRMDKELLAANIFFAISKTPDISFIKSRLLINLKSLAQFIIQLPSKIVRTLKQIIPLNLFEKIKDISRGFHHYLDPYEEDILGSIGIVALLMLWIDEFPIKHILTPFSPNFSGGDFRELIRISEWLIYCSRELSSTIGLDISMIKMLETIRKRVEYGITEDLLELVSIPGIGRVRARQLKNHGFDSLAEIANSSINDLIKIPGIGPTIANKIIRYCRQKVRFSKID